MFVSISISREIPTSFGHEAPAFLIDVPLLLDVDDLSNSPGTNYVPHGQLIGFAAVLRSHLHYLHGLFDRIACFLCLVKIVGKRLLYITVLAAAHDFLTKLGVLEITRCNQHCIDVFISQHLLGILILLWLQLESFFHLCGTLLAGHAPQIANSRYFHWKLLRG